MSRVRRQNSHHSADGDDGGSSSPSGGTVPAVCYDVCNEPMMLAQQIGKSPELCAPNSAFMQGLDTCRTCINEWAPGLLSDNSTNGEQFLSEFAQYLDYCDQSDATINSILAQISTLQNSLSSMGYTGTASKTPVSTDATTTSTTTATGATLPVTVTTIYTTPTITRTGTDTGTPGGDSGSGPKVGVIVPAVVVPVVVIIAFIFGFIFMRRRRRERQGTDETRPDDDKKDIPDKAQLHADEFRPELDGTPPVAEIYTKKGAGDIAELPAREPVGMEMDAAEKR